MQINSLAGVTTVIPKTPDYLKKVLIKVDFFCEKLSNYLVSKFMHQIATSITIITLFQVTYYKNCFNTI